MRCFEQEISFYHFWLIILLNALTVSLDVKKFTQAGIRTTFEVVCQSEGKGNIREEGGRYQGIWSVGVEQDDRNFTMSVFVLPRF